METNVAKVIISLVDLYHLVYLALYSHAVEPSILWVWGARAQWINP